MTQTDRGSQGTDPPSRQLAAYLREQITTGRLSQGEKLPSERALVAEHSVARNTAREAIRQLAAAGLVTAEHGRGVFVRNKPRLMRLGESRYSKRLRDETGISPFHAEVQAQGRTPSAKCTSVKRVRPPDEIAARLHVEQDDRTVVRRENWYYADDEPIQIGVTYIPWAIAKDSPLSMTGDRLGKGDLYARFEDKGHLITYTREEVTARMPTPDEVTGLEIPDGVPILEVLHTGLDQNRVPFEVTRFTMRADFTGLDYTMPVDES